MSEISKAVTYKHSGLKVREVTIDDLLLIYYWNNDPDVRFNSFNPETITLENHSNWFREKLKSADCKIYVIESLEKPAAQIRFTVTENIATISYLVAAEFRGKGLGVGVINLGLDRLKVDFPKIALVEGLVKCSNKASIRVFEKVGFNYDENQAHQSKFYRFVLNLDV
jgi:UDP-2,4-diacetamido-2,4,6-trideoxy-beta-L-altropyranose hydrolase